MNKYKSLFFVILFCMLTLTAFASQDSIIFPSNMWQSATPESQGIDPNKLNKALDYLKENSGGTGTDEMVIIRNGYLIWKGSSADNNHELYSCTKTFTSTILGLLVTDGIVDVDDYAVQYLPSLDDQYPEYAKIKLSHLASMTSGYDSKLGDGWEFYRSNRAKHLEYVLQYIIPGPPMFPAGTSFKYHDPGVHILGYILTKVAGQSLEQLFKKRVAETIGMEHFTWSNYGNRDGIVFNNPAGTPDENQGGVYSNALDLARYGLLYLNNGNWNGKQILSQSYVERATSTQVPASLQTKYIDLTGRYGFYWWTNGIKADGTQPWPSAPPKTYAAHGAGRNYIFVIPEWKMVIVRLSPAPNGDIQSGSVPKGVWECYFSLLK